MTRFSRFFIILTCFILTSCSSGNDLTEAERPLVGAWFFEIGPSPQGDRNFKYVQLDANRKGINGLAIQRDAPLKLVMPLGITKWKLHADTLIIEYLMMGGKFSGPGRKDTVISDFPMTDRWIIKQMTDTSFMAESYDPEIPFTAHVMFRKSSLLE